MDWKEICASVPSLNGMDWDISKENTWSRFIISLEFCKGCNLLEWVWEGGMPGQSGHNFKLEIKAYEKQNFLESMEELRRSLEQYWKEHHLPEVN